MMVTSFFQVSIEPTFYGRQVFSRCTYRAVWLPASQTPNKASNGLATCKLAIDLHQSVPFSVINCNEIFVESGRLLNEYSLCIFGSDI